MKHFKATSQISYKQTKCNHYLCTSIMRDHLNSSIFADVSIRPQQSAITPLAFAVTDYQWNKAKPFPECESH